MEQEIHGEVETTGKLVKLFFGGSNSGRNMLAFLKKHNFINDLGTLVAKVMDAQTFAVKRELFDEFVKSAVSNRFIELLEQENEPIYQEVVHGDFEKKYFFSGDKNVFIDLADGAFDKKRLLVAKALDSIVESYDVSEFVTSMHSFIEIITNTINERRNIYTIACGSSYHSAKIGALYFNEIAGIEIQPILPGEFRGQYSNSLKEGDAVIGVSQSGETKDLIDIFNDIDNLGINIKKIVLVNNLNSTLGQEKSEVAIPICCGPEIAVPATKSFINQITLFYYLAVKTLEMKIDIRKKQGLAVDDLENQLVQRLKSIEDIPALIHETIKTTKDSIEQVAEAIYLDPSIHILATRISGVAKEGALKIRETVLNHTEGAEASEFKHGPNTILGKNTVIGIDSMFKVIKHYNKIADEIHQQAVADDLPADETRNIVAAMVDHVFTKATPFNLSKKGTILFEKVVEDRDFFAPMFKNYPLIYVTGPEVRDINLTVSQINTHKIRGANTFVIAEENEQLQKNASFCTGNNSYKWGYITLPKTGDGLMTTFSSSIVLQMLALKMSIKKMNYLNRLGMKGHGVHPDIPKNVSKSITVD